MHYSNIFVHKNVLERKARERKSTSLQEKQTTCFLFSFSALRSFLVQVNSVDIFFHLPYLKLLLHCTPLGKQKTRENAFITHCIACLPISYHHLKGKKGKGHRIVIRYYYYQSVYIAAHVCVLWTWLTDYFIYYSFLLTTSSQHTYYNIPYQVQCRK